MENSDLPSNKCNNVNTSQGELEEGRNWLKHKVEVLDFNTGSFMASGLRNEAVTGLFLDF